MTKMIENYAPQYTSVYDPKFCQITHHHHCAKYIKWNVVKFIHNIALVNLFNSLVSHLEEKAFHFARHYVTVHTETKPLPQYLFKFT